MFWAFAAVITNVVEQLLITKLLFSLDIVVFAMLFYTTSTIIMSVLHLKNHKTQIADFKYTFGHKFLLLGYVGGSFWGNVLWFISLTLIGVGMAAFILVFVRVIVTAYSYIYMNDRFSIDKAIAFSIGIIALLIFSFSNENVNAFGALLAVISCFGFAAEIIFRKKLIEANVNSDNAIIARNATLSLLWWSIFAVGCIWGAYSIESLTEISSHIFLLLLLTAILGGILGHQCAFKAMRTIKLSQYESLSALKPVLLAIGGILLFDESITFTQSIAGAVIIVSTFYFLRGKKTS